MPAHALRNIACLLIAVLLATVLSPSFGWEASASVGAHGHDTVLVGDCDANAAQHHGDEDSHHHHGCAGHVLGHLQAQLSDPYVFAALDPAGNLLPEPLSDFSLLFPKRLDRPPLASASA